MADRRKKCNLHTAAAQRESLFFFSYGSFAMRQQGQIFIFFLRSFFEIFFRQHTWTKFIFFTISFFLSDEIKFSVYANERKQVRKKNMENNLSSPNGVQ